MPKEFVRPIGVEKRINSDILQYKRVVKLWVSGFLQIWSYQKTLKIFPTAAREMCDSNI